MIRSTLGRVDPMAGTSDEPATKMLRSITTHHCGSLQYDANEASACAAWMRRWMKPPASNNPAAEHVRFKKSRRFIIWLPLF